MKVIALARILLYRSEAAFRDVCIDVWLCVCDCSMFDLYANSTLISKYKQQAIPRVTEDCTVCTAATFAIDFIRNIYFLQAG